MDNFITSPYFYQFRCLSSLLYFTGLNPANSEFPISFQLSIKTRPFAGCFTFQAFRINPANGEFRGCLTKCFPSPRFHFRILLWKIFVLLIYSVSCLIFNKIFCLTSRSKPSTVTCLKNSDNYYTAAKDCARHVR